MVSDLWAGELFNTHRLPSASGEGTSTAKLLTFSVQKGEEMEGCVVF